MVNAQYQALRNENFRQNQALFRKCTAVDGYLKKRIITSVEPFLLYPLVERLTEFTQVSTLTILQHLFLIYMEIYGIDREENDVKMMRPYDSAEPLARLIEQLEKGR